MMLRTFIAPDMPSAIRMMREELGDEAIILSSEPDRSQKGIRVMAAVDKDEPSSHPLPLREGAGGGGFFNNSPFDKIIPHPNPPPQGGREYDQLRFELQNILRFHNIPEIFIAKLLRKASDGELSPLFALQRMSGRMETKQLHAMVLEKLLSSFFAFDPLPLEQAHLRLMLIGAPGIGKTLTIAKLATRLSLDKNQGGALAVITTDNKRAGGVEQLQAFTDILGLTLYVAPTFDELKDYLQSLAPRARVLVDTAGCNPFDPSELQALQPFTQLPGIEPIMVLPAGGDSLEAIDMMESFATMPVKRLLVTRADTARRFGGIITAAAAHDLAFCNVSLSSSIADALPPLSGATLAQLLLKHTL